MGLDLMLLPFDGEFSSGAYSHTILNCERRRTLFDKLNELDAYHVPKDFDSFCSRDEGYEGPHYGNTTEDEYGDRLTFVYAEDLTRLKNHEGVLNSVKNKATWAYISELPPDTKVALYWH